MGRYSPTVLPDTSENPALAAFLDELSKGPERLSQRRADQRADTRAQQETDTYNYQKGQRPLEDAMRAAALHEQGILRPGEQPSQGQPQAPSEPAAPSPRGGHLPPFLDELGGGATLPAGAYNPVSGSFQPPQGMPGTGRVDLGGGYTLDESQTPRGRTLAMAEDDARRLTEAGIPAGIARYAAHHPNDAEHILSTFLERQHPTGGWHPGSMAEAIDLYRQTVGSRDKKQQLEMPMDKAFEQVDNMYGRWEGGVMIGHRLNPGARYRMAQQIARGEWNPTDAPKTITPGNRAARENANAHSGGKPVFTQQEVDQAPVDEQDDAQAIQAATSLIERYPELDDQDLTDALKHHGYNDDQISRALRARKKPAPAAAARPPTHR